MKTEEELKEFEEEFSSLSEEEQTEVMDWNIGG